MMTMSSMMLMFADGDDADADADADEMYALILLFIVGRAMHLQ